MSFVSETRFLVNTYGTGDCGLWLYSLEGLSTENARTPVHIATFLFPPLLPTTLAMTLLAESRREGYNSKTNRRPFTTAKGASIFVADLSCFSRPYSGRPTVMYRMFIHPSAFSSRAMGRLEVEGSLPEVRVIPWASWGPTSTRLLDHTAGGTFFGYNVGYDGKQLNFNALDIVRDIHRARNSIRDLRDPPLHTPKVFDRHSPTTIPANGIFQEDVTTYLPYRSWDVRIPGCQVIPSEDWIHFAST